MKLWGGRFGKATDGLVDDFHSSISFDQRLYEQDITGSIAHATMLGEEGIIPAEDAAKMLEMARTCDGRAAERILVKGKATVTEGAAEVFAKAGIRLYGNESQTVGPEDAPMAVHKIMLGAEIVLLEGIRLSEVPEGVYLLSAAPINLGGSDGAPCRAILMDLNS